MIVKKAHEIWWKKAQFYQIWCRSFCDSNGDGVGDLKGITSKIDYLKDLGIDAIWLTPFFKSPNKDNGYDISNYLSVDPLMGDMRDFEELAEKVHANGMKIIIDLVVNHCSNQHEWFVKSCQGDPKYKDYFIWKDGRGEGGMKPPNNWGAVFSGPTWTYSEERKQFYFHMFSPEQPDLNWENPEVRKEVVEIIRFWNKKGIDGIRLDATCHISKPEGLPDYDTDEPFVNGEMHYNGPRMHEYIRIICETIRETEGNVSFGEMASIPLDQMDLSLDPKRGEMDMAILFEHTAIDFDYHPVMGKFNYTGPRLYKLKKYIKDWYTLIKEGWINLHLCNHDQPRVVSRWGDEGVHWSESAKMLGMLYHFMRGTPFIYQGEEIGMTNWRFTLDQADDIEFKRYYQVLVKEKGLLDEETFMKVSHIVARDTSRSPVQWTPSANAGFTSGKPWLPVNENYVKINAETEEKDPKSVLNFFKRIIATRKAHDMLIDGEIELIFEDKDTIFGYRRFLPNESEEFIALFNFSSLYLELANSPHFDLERDYEVVLCNYEGYKVNTARLEVKPWIGLLLRSRPRVQSKTDPEQ